MTYSIIFSSKTGNTALLAETLKTSLPANRRLSYGTIPDAAPEADLLFVGFWTDKGDCDADTAAYLEGLYHQRLFLFGTAGFGGDKAYFQQILARVQSHLNDSNTVVGSWMCQGKMPLSVRQKYEAMLPQAPEKMQGLLDHFDRALTHPDAHDLAELEQVANRCLSEPVR